MARKQLFVLLLSVVLAAAQIPSLGYCPEYQPKEDFDLERFMGKWYEAEKYFTFSEIGSRCVVTDYAQAPSGKIYISNEVTNRVTGIKRIIEGNLNLAGKSGEGKLLVKYATVPIGNEQTLVVLETDYDDFAVVWSCYRLGLVHTQNVWVMTRDRLPTNPTLQKAYGVLDKFKISRTFFVTTDQAGCALAASDLNAINGITGISTVPEVYGEEQKHSGGDKETAKGAPSQDNAPKVDMEKMEPEQVKLEEAKLEEAKLEEVKLDEAKLVEVKLEETKPDPTKLDKEKLDKEKCDKETLEKEKLDKERVDKDRVDKERVDKEKLDKENLGTDKLEKEKLAKEKLEQVPNFEKGKEGTKGKTIKGNAFQELSKVNHKNLLITEDLFKKEEDPESFQFELTINGAKESISISNKKESEGALNLTKP